MLNKITVIKLHNLPANPEIDLFKEIATLRPHYPTIEGIKILWVKTKEGLLNPTNEDGHHRFFGGDLMVHADEDRFIFTSQEPLEFIQMGVEVRSAYFVKPEGPYVSSGYVARLKEWNETKLRPELLDEGIYPFVMACNKIPGLATRWSCTGHVQGKSRELPRAHVMFYGEDKKGILMDFFLTLLREEPTLQSGLTSFALNLKQKTIITDFPADNIIADYKALCPILEFHRYLNTDVEVCFNELTALLEKVLAKYGIRDTEIKEPYMLPSAYARGFKVKLPPVGSKESAIVYDFLFEKLNASWDTTDSAVPEEGNVPDDYLYCFKRGDGIKMTTNGNTDLWKEDVPTLTITDVETLI